MAGQMMPLPVPVILAAINGSEDALAVVLAHYRNYIRFLATRPLKDRHGNKYLCIDETVRLMLEAKLIYSIVTDFQILSI